MITLSGKRTYIVGITGIAWAIIGLIFGWLEGVEATNIILASLAALGLRAGINN